MNLIKRLYAFVTRRRLVWLRDYDNRISLSIAFTDPWGDLCAKRAWPADQRVVRLLRGGVVDGCIVKLWKYADGKGDE